MISVFSCTLNRIRTCDPCLRRAVLFPLSYEGIPWSVIIHITHSFILSVQQEHRKPCWHTCSQTMHSIMLSRRTWLMYRGIVRVFNLVLLVSGEPPCRRMPR